MIIIRTLRKDIANYNREDDIVSDWLYSTKSEMHETFIDSRGNPFQDVMPLFLFIWLHNVGDLTFFFKELCTTAED